MDQTLTKPEPSPLENRLAKYQKGLDSLNRQIRETDNLSAQLKEMRLQQLGAVSVLTELVEEEKNATKASGTNAG